MMKSGIPEVLEGEFKEKVLGSDKPVIVEFGAEWCRPCKSLEPVLKKLGVEWEGKAVLFQIDVDQAQNLTQQFSIFSVPTIILFIKGKPIERMTGFQPESKLRNKIGSYL
jgi:thioredoxin